jgi:hypothetical protein
MTGVLSDSRGEPQNLSEGRERHAHYRRHNRGDDQSASSPVARGYGLDSSHTAVIRSANVPFTPISDDLYQKATDGVNVQSALKNIVAKTTPQKLPTGALYVLYLQNVRVTLTVERALARLFFYVLVAGFQRSCKVFG